MQVSGFYAVLDRDDEELARTLVGPGGAKILQVRIKPGDARDVVRIAKLARKICDAAGALLVINDRIDIALAVRADAVHLGQTDLSLRDARSIAGDRLAIGLSTHNPEQVASAVALRPDYIAYGPVFATTTKQNPDPVVGLDALRNAVAAAGDIPVVAIGGITATRVPEIYAAGAAAICAISSVNAASDVVAAARAFARPTS
jgi:thiamine-phosphate pyrophosphorylase